MATAKKLPSGSWRIRVYDYTDDAGKKHYRSFTCDDPSAKGKRKCEKAAADWAADKENSKNSSILFSEALDQYIASRENVLSPRTIMDYKRIRKSYVQTLMPLYIDRITPEDVQEAINLESLHLSPKSIRNIHGLISATLKIFRPGFTLNTSLPQKIRPQIYVPSNDELRRLLKYVEGKDLELPILLAAFGPMRRGEICALDSRNITGNTVHVCSNMVRTEDNTWIIRQPKTYAGDRYIYYPDFVAAKWEGKRGRIVNMTPNNITDRFGRVLKAAGLPHFRFHDLRHYSASIMHALNIPDSYIMQRGGWGNDGVLKSVYRHTMASKEAEINGIANDYFSVLYDTKYDTK